MTDDLTLDFVLRLLHFLGAIIAIGGVIASDAVNVFMHLRPRTAPANARLSPVFSIVIWLGFFVLAVTGVLVFLEVPGVIHDGLFQAKMVLVAIVFANGVFVNWWVAPRFQRLAGEWDEQTERVQRFTKIAAAAAGISVLGWFATVIVSYSLAH